jgi:hypothetical protein
VKNKLCRWVLIAAAGIAVTTVSATGASAYLFEASKGSLSASADFRVSESNLIVTLTNTSTADVSDPSDVLTAVFFTFVDDPVLKPVSAVVPVSSRVLFGGTDPGGAVGGEWAYADQLSGAPHGANQGISSSGLGLFGAANFPPYNNLQDPADSVDGLQYGITSAGDNPATGNQKVTGSQALIQNQVVFTLSGLPSGFDVSSISNVSFQYGTALNEPNISVPDASIVLLLGSSLLGLGLLGRRKSTK